MRARAGARTRSSAGPSRSRPDRAGGRPCRAGDPASDTRRLAVRTPAIARRSTSPRRTGASARRQVRPPSSGVPGSCRPSGPGPIPMWTRRRNTTPTRAAMPLAPSNSPSTADRASICWHCARWRRRRAMACRTTASAWRWPRPAITRPPSRCCRLRCARRRKCSLPGLPWVSCCCGRASKPPRAIRHPLWRPSGSARRSSILRTATAQRPTYGLAHLSLGHALRGQGRSADALAEFRRAVACQPELADAQPGAGRGARGRRGRDASPPSPGAAQSLSPTDPRPPAALARLRDPGTSGAKPERK